MLMHTKTRKRDLVDTLFHLGLSVSYDRVLRLHSIAQLYVTVVGSVRD